MSEAAILPINFEILMSEDPDTLLERAYTARKLEVSLGDQILQQQDAFQRTEEYQAAKAKLEELEKEFEESVKTLNNRIDSLRNQQQEWLREATEADLREKVTPAGVFKIKQRSVRKIVPEKFWLKFGPERFTQVASIKLGDAEKIVSKVELEECVVREYQGSPSIEFVPGGMQK